MSENVRVVVPASDPAAHTLDMAHVLVDEPDPLRRDMRWSEVVTSFRNTEVSRPASEGHKRFQETWFMRQALPLSLSLSLSLWRGERRLRRNVVA
jgi:hypothetical protein